MAAPSHPVDFRLFRCLWLAAGLTVGWAASPVAAADPAGLAAQPLQTRSTGTGSTLFTPLPGDQTGITMINAYDDPLMWGVRYREFSLGAIGTGVAIADYDGDGRPDVFVVNKTGPNRLYRNLGGFKFEDVTDRAGVAGPAGPWKQGAAFADVNNDGRPDLYVCRFGAPNLLFVNRGDGTFAEEAAARGLALQDASNMAAFCDYDRDGWLDVYVQTNLLDGERRPNGQRDHLYRNHRDGTFTEVTDQAGIAGESQGHAATWWDYDEDGWPDLYVDNDFKDADRLYRNHRDGTFTNVLDQAVPHTPYSSMGADLGDVDNDGHTDLLIADMAATTREKDHRGMAKIRAGLDEKDAVPGAAPQVMRNALLLGTGTPRTLEGSLLAGLAATDWTWTVRLEDLDLDGRLDAYFTNGMVRELHAQDVIQRMMGRESMAERRRIMQATPVLAERHLAFRNLGDLQFEEVGKAWGLDQVGVGFGAAFGDLDGDGDLDLVYASMDAPVTVLRNDSASGHAVVIDLHGTVSNRFGVGAVVRIETSQGRQMRTLVLARGYLSTSEPVVHFGLGGEATIRRLAIEWPSGATQEFENLAADRRYSITEPAETGAVPPPRPRPPLFTEMGARLKLGDPTPGQAVNEWAREPLLPFRLNTVAPAAAVADLDRDGQDDFILGGGTGESGRVMSNLGDGEFMAYGANVFPDSSVPDGPLLVFDADGDGDLDLLATKAGTAAAAGSRAYEPRLALNNGRGRFTLAAAGTLPSWPVSAGAAVAADFEHSGRPGIFLGGRCVPGAYPEVPRSMLVAWRGDRYADVTAEVAPGLERIGLVTAALWSDVDEDGWPDLLVACEWGRVAVFRNREGRQFEDVTESLGFASGGTGWWRSLAAADFNGDGRLDYAAGNTGLNTRYRASPAEPALLYAGRSVAAESNAGSDLGPTSRPNGTVGGGNSTPLLLEAQAEKGIYYPLRDRDTLAKLFPAALRPFASAEAYARAKLADIFPDATLAGTTRLAVTELRNGIFLSQPDGTWKFTALPRRAQLAPMTALATGDFDGDGHTDLLAVGNSFTATVETGRFDGALGWLLRGDGHGRLEPVAVAESGFVVPGEARALLTTDYDQDGWPDFLVTQHDDRSLFFRNGGRAGGHSFAVMLRGAVTLGARLTLTLGNGASQAVEAGPGPVFFGWPEGNPPASLKIRWPDGRVSEQTFTRPPAKILTITTP
ncbi:MAG TPA: FG-GAP-like repeat-containing protein [Lacunisphaera sp.]|nr:FG-GAP-like repeat-containing protein [Lacunisphaera sp.]